MDAYCNCDFPVKEREKEKERKGGGGGGGEEGGEKVEVSNDLIR